MNGQPLDNSKFPAIFRLVVLAVHLTLAIALAICSADTFARVAFTPDSQSYLDIANGLASGELPIGRRTLGYPTLLAAAQVVAGPQLGPRLVIVLQLGANLLLMWMAWRLLAMWPSRLSTRMKLLIVSILGLATLGQAMEIMTDHAAAVGLALWWMGLAYWRSPLKRGLAGSGLFAATLLRPTFTLMPLVLLPLAWWLRNTRLRLSAPVLLSWLAFCLAATGLNIGYQLYSYDCATPSSVGAWNAALTLQRAGVIPASDHREILAQWRQNLAKRSTAAPQAVGVCDLEHHGLAVLKREALAHPVAIGGQLAKTAVKYSLAPNESSLINLLELLGADTYYNKAIRVAVVLVSFPLWLLLVLPFGKTSPAPRRMLWQGCLLLFVAVILVSSVAPEQGERMRLPVLFALVLPWAWSLEWLVGKFRDIRAKSR